MTAPDLLEIEEARTSLEYWEGRRRALPLYRPGARREAKAMAARWEERIQIAERARFDASILGRLLAVLGLSGLWLRGRALRSHGVLSFAWALVPRPLKLIVAAWAVTALAAATVIAALLTQLA